MRRAAVIWDMDGVLVDSGRLHYEAWRWIAEGRGAALTHETFLPTLGMTNPDAIRAMFGAVPEAEGLELARRKEAEFRVRLRGNVRGLPGAEALVRALHAAGHPQAVASSAPRENVDAIIEALGLAACFGAVASGDEVTRGKPNPRIFILAALKLGVPPVGCVVVEDAVVGVQAGIRAGMRVYAVTNTRRREELAEADRVVDSLEELSPADFRLA